MAKSVSKPIPHDSGHKHVTGQSTYIDDIAEFYGTLHMALGLATIARGAINAIDLSAVRAAAGIVDVITYDDLPADRDVSPVHAGDEPLLADREIFFHGQAIFAVVAKTRDQARRAARLAQIEYVEEVPIISIDEALAAGAQTVIDGTTFKRGETHDKAANRLSGSLTMGGQEQFYLEGQIAYSIPGEDGEVTIYSSTQNPTEIQHVVAAVLGVPANKVTVEARRLGGGFGGKETQPVYFAALSALAAQRLGRAVKLRVDRDDDFALTGKRHDFKMDYDIGYGDDGVIDSFDAVLNARCGYSADLSASITDRALLHSDNCYYYANVRLQSKPLKTNTVSNTAFRGFGGPQGVLMAEQIIEDIAYERGLDPLDVRLRNLYTDENNVTPYHQIIPDNISRRVITELAERSDYRARRAAVMEFNANNRWVKKGIALSPVKFGISFTASWLNQAGATVNIYQDGTVQVNHGAIEMGQGVNVKIAQVVADEFGVPLDHIIVTPTNTSKVPNSSATAASTGTDLNAMAALDAARKVKSAFMAEFGDAEFVNGQVVINGEATPWVDMVKRAYFARVPLFSSGFYKTPEVGWDRAAGRGNPFYYFAYGAACTELTVDRLTGDYVFDRVDIDHDVGKSINPAIDLGQVEGGFIQGLGWLTREELVWDDKGVMRTHAPSTYKIPLASDIPKVMDARLVDWAENVKPAIKRSKAVGEPPFCLAISGYLALDMAVRSVGGDSRVPTSLAAPATPERVLLAMNARDAI